MKINEIQNCKVGEDGSSLSVFSKNREELVISKFEVEFPDKFESFRKDHCDCITTSIIKVENKLLFTAVTMNGDIDEYITISIYGESKKHFRIRFLRP